MHAPDIVAAFRHAQYVELGGRGIFLPIQEL
jgi:hypothetical protein